MADIVLAECSGQAWLVRGEQHIDELLANLLEPHVTIEVVTCESKSAVNALAHEYGAVPGAQLWLIHPAIVNRARGETPGVSADFSEWSALLSERALTDLSKIAALALRRADMNIVLTCYIAADAATTAIDLTNLRVRILEGRLATLGVSATRILRQTEIDAAKTDRIDLILRLS
jgi:hypothetical protein